MPQKVSMAGKTYDIIPDGIYDGDYFPGFGFGFGVWGDYVFREQMMGIKMTRFERLDMMKLLDTMLVGEQMVNCASCGALGFGLKRAKTSAPYTAVCLGCGEETVLSSTAIADKNAR